MALHTLTKPQDLIGQRVITPKGIRWVVGYSMQRDQFQVAETPMADDGEDWGVEYLHESRMPDRGSPSAMAAWLNDESPMYEFRPPPLAEKACACTCNACYVGVRGIHTIRGHMLCTCEQKGCGCAH